MHWTHPFAKASDVSTGTHRAETDAMTHDRQHAAAAALRALHTRPGGFTIPNAWDAGTALIMAAEGFEAIASTSAGIAFSLGKQDYGVTEAALAVSPGEMFDALRRIVGAVGVPVSADLEAGFGDTPQDVADCIRLAVDAGLAGGNIEDKRPLQAGLYDEVLALERIAAARQALDALANPFVLNARTDILLVEGSGALGACVRRANLMAEAGADCIFVPGPTDPQVARILAREIDAPLNLVVGLGPSAVGPRALLDAGVQRVSVGGSIARAALGFIRDCVRELRDEGTIGYAARQIHGGELNAAFARGRPGRVAA
jgi:2-methylisocitrate lyase-like PEP mutase family enzyme